MPDQFRDRLEKDVLLCDGAMGTLLFARGVSYQHCFDEVNLSNPKLVQQIHQDYIQAGAELVETNTFGANPVKLIAHGLEDKVREINFRGAKIAREAREIVGKPVFVAGSIGPLGKPLEPIGKITRDQALAYFRQQAEALLEGGVDLFILETMVNLEEMKQAILAVRQICELPVIAQMTFTEEGKTIMGNAPEEVVQELEALKVDVIGANCSVGPLGIFEVVQRIVAKTKLKVSAQPNAGLPRLVDGRFIYFSTPEYFAEYASKFALAGVKIVGGCCGTTPQHVRAMHEALQSLKESGSGGDISVNSTTVAEAGTDKIETITPVQEEVSEFARKLRKKKFVVSVELDPPKGVNPEKLLEGARALKHAGADACNIGDSPHGPGQDELPGFGLSDKR